MKLAFFDDFKVGVVAGDSVVDVTDVGKDISRLCRSSRKGRFVRQANRGRRRH